MTHRSETSCAACGMISVAYNKAGMDELFFADLLITTIAFLIFSNQTTKSGAPIK